MELSNCWVVVMIEKRAVKRSSTPHPLQKLKGSGTQIVPGWGLIWGNREWGWVVLQFELAD
jgi:hypothetical protein